MLVSSLSLPLLIVSEYDSKILYGLPLALNQKLCSLCKTLLALINIHKGKSILNAKRINLSKLLIEQNNFYGRRLYFPSHNYTYIPAALEKAFLSHSRLE